VDAQAPAHDGLADEIILGAGRFPADFAFQRPERLAANFAGAPRVAARFEKFQPVLVLKHRSLKVERGLYCFSVTAILKGLIAIRTLSDELPK
jgi:hypothetical protein